MPIVWKFNKMSTGVPALDASHREWIRCLNELERTILFGGSLDRVQKVLDFMVKCAELNFSHEEIMTRGLITPAAKINQSEHDHFRKMARTIRERLGEQNISWREIVSLEIEMEKWLVRHLCNVDARLWPLQNTMEEIPMLYGAMV